MKRRLGPKRLFLISLVGFLVVFFVISGDEVASFNFFSAWVAKKNQAIGDTGSKNAADTVWGSTEDAVVLGTTLANVKVGRGQRYGSSLLQRTLQALAKTQTLLMVDLSDLLWSAPDRRVALTAYQRSMEALAEEVSLTSEWLTSLIQDRQTRAQECLSAKNEGDQRFFAGIQEYNAVEAQAGIDQSMQEWPCYITNRVEASSYDYLSQTLAVSNQLLARRMEVINNNAEAIIQYFPLIEDGTLQQLQEVQQQLEIVRTSTSYQSVGSFFQRGIPEDTSGPQLIDVWFGGREIPTYLQGWYIGQ